MKLTTQQRGVVFWLACLPTRWFLATRGNVPALRIFAAFIGTRWLIGKFDDDKGQFGGPVWWADERALHGMLWSAYAATGQQGYLQADVLAGALNWLTTDKLSYNNRLVATTSARVVASPAY